VPCPRRPALAEGYPGGRDTPTIPLAIYGISPATPLRYPGDRETSRVRRLGPPPHLMSSPLEAVVHSSSLGNGRLEAGSNHGPATTCGMMMETSAVRHRYACIWHSLPTAELLTPPQSISLRAPRKVTRRPGQPCTSSLLARSPSEDSHGFQAIYGFPTATAGGRRYGRVERVGKAVSRRCARQRSVTTRPTHPVQVGRTSATGKSSIKNVGKRRG